ncbi:MAG: hypothetical protein K940chlam7_01837 [Chlamydiae bacterium]|nr:hypothetical protein [Chlamydiota bacterium]
MRKKTMLTEPFLSLLVLFALALSPAHAQQTDPLPSWIEGPTKSGIIHFVQEITEQGGPHYVRPEERIATFDNDGTLLWTSHPMYFQLFFAIDRIHKLAPDHPEWKTTQPFKAVLDNDMKTLAAAGQKGILELIMATHAGKRGRSCEKRGRKKGPELRCAIL